MVGKKPRKIAVYSRNWSNNNHERRKEINRKSYYANREKNLLYYRKYRVENIDKVKLKEKKYRQRNKEKILINNEIRRTREKGAYASLTKKQWDEIKNHFNNTCAYCGKSEKLVREHFIPLVKGGEFAITNVIPACSSCNSSKSAKDFFEWYPTYEYYDKQREKKILDFLGYKNGKQQLVFF